MEYLKELRVADAQAVQHLFCDSAANDKKSNKLLEERRDGYWKERSVTELKLCNTYFVTVQLMRRKVISC